MKKKVMIAGTFDILHPGHIFLINQAAKLGEVYVIVATDKNREKYSGSPPVVPEQQRLEVVKNIKKVKDARLGRKDNNTLKTVEEINPDIILLGPDQKYKISELKKGLKSQGLNHIDVRRLDIYYDKFELNSSSKIKEKIIKRYKENKM
jgi:FAD synthetase